MSISAIPAVSTALPTLPTQATTATTAAPAAGNDSFGGMVSNAIDSLSGAQANADGLAVQAATGKLTDVHDYMIAATQASLATELTVAVRNKAVDAFNDIMRMQI